MSDTYLFDGPKKYIAQAGNTRKHRYQLYSLIIVSIQYSIVGAMSVAIPILEQDPIFLCPNADDPGGA